MVKEGEGSGNVKLTFRLEDLFGLSKPSKTKERAKVLQEMFGEKNGEHAEKMLKKVKAKPVKKSTSKGINISDVWEAIGIDRLCYRWCCREITKFVSEKGIRLSPGPKAVACFLLCIHTGEDGKLGTGEGYSDKIKGLTGDYVKSFYDKISDVSDETLFKEIKNYIEKGKKEYDRRRRKRIE